MAAFGGVNVPPLPARHDGTESDGSIGEVNEGVSRAFRHFDRLRAPVSIAYLGVNRRGRVSLERLAFGQGAKRWGESLSIATRPTAIWLSSGQHKNRYCFSD